MISVPGVISTVGVVWASGIGAPVGRSDLAPAATISAVVSGMASTGTPRRAAPW
ncbi:MULTISPECIES: hypothetical protein [Streptomyces]|uniref:hypothetical protein n=1 Tax=Streptomyces TaxID=1883 RepID=UPI0008E6ED07|nr:MULTISPECIES: hypothetical protein [unclassified Streptomyces]SFM69506.1 hypothetical protein SAMN04487980_1004121 [Streptomyces sp. cf124]